jgi:homoserine kinase
VHGLLAADGDARRAEAIPSILEGERAATPSVHGDNVVPSLMGGVVLVQPHDPTRFRRIPVPVEAWFAILRPQMQVLTEEARAVLPQQVALADSVANGAELAFLVDALRAGDLAAAGHAMGRDQIVEPVRIRLIPGFARIQSAALETGALGCTLSGSGPALFALSASRGEAEKILDAMVQAAAPFHPDAGRFVTRIDTRGARGARPDEPLNVL